MATGTRDGIRLISATLLAGALGLAATSAVAGDNDGEAVARLAANWWQWQEANFGPANFDFGEGMVDCRVGQRGQVWYLGGAGGPEPVERQCIDPVPAGKRLFFPLLNLLVWDEPLDTDERRALLDDILGDLVPGLFNSEACRLDVTLDGERVIFDGTPIHRVQSPPFEYDGDPAAVSDGFWVLLPRLSGGQHSIRFTGSLCSFATGEPFFGVDVTYVLEVTGRRGNRARRDASDD